MRNCIILGAARSGTSLTAGCLASAGYFMGDDLMKPRDSNPRGFFEDYHINAINDRILLTTQSGLLRHLPKGSALAGKWFGYHHKWLLHLPADKQIIATEQQREEIKKATSKEPFCFKDPRFCYTLQVWKPFLKDAVRICVFRHPNECAESMVKESQTQDETKKLNLSKADCLNIYQAMYQRVLQEMNDGDWIFIHYKQMLNGDGVKRLEDVLGANVDSNFADCTLHRNKSTEQISGDLNVLYNQLNKLAGFQDE